MCEVVELPPLLKAEVLFYLEHHDFPRAKAIQNAWAHGHCHHYCKAKNRKWHFHWI